MTLTLDFPGSRRSPLGVVDPRWKLAALVPAAVLVGLLRDWRLSLAALGLVLLLVAVARLPWLWYLARMGSLTLFLLLFLAWPVFFPTADEATWDTGWFVVSLPRLTHLVGLLARALALVSLVLVVLATAPLPDTLKAAHALHVPGLLLQLTLLTYRYLFLLGEELKRLRIALRVRAFRNRASVHSYRTIGQVAGTLLVRSYERAERVGQAMRARGFDGTFRSMHGFQTRAADVVFFLSVIALAGGLLAWDSCL
jgi:cobalt/nickel transport system permease protein